MYCSCGKKLSEKAKFCPGCGKKVDRDRADGSSGIVRSSSVSRDESRQKRCKKCGTMNKDTAKFCRNCASPLEISGGGSGFSHFHEMPPL